MTYIHIDLPESHVMVPHAILFDLDETLIDRTQSIGCYAERLQRDFADNLAPTTASTIAATIVAADERGYRPREELFCDLVQHLPWQTPPRGAAPAQALGDMVSSLVCGARGAWRDTNYLPGTGDTARGYHQWCSTTPAA